MTEAVHLGSDVEWDLGFVESPIMLSFKKLVVAPAYNLRGQLKDQAADLRLGEMDGAKLLGEFVTVPAAIGLTRLPDGVDFQTGGALGLAGTAARLAVDAVELTAGRTVLIAGATGGVGTIAVQLAAQAGARVVATAHGEKARGLVTGLGAAEVADYTADMAGQVHAAHPDGIDAVLHFAGDPGALLPLVRAGGRLSGTVRAIEYQGTHLQVTLTADTQDELTALVNEAEFDAVAPRPGDTLALDWREQDIHRLSS